MKMEKIKVDQVNPSSKMINNNKTWKALIDQ